MIRRRSGWFTTVSYSDVVKPAPVKAERAWKRATSSGNPERHSGKPNEHHRDRQYGK
jgi:hypothetical protein